MSNSIINITPLGFPWATNDPFLFCAYHRDIYPAGEEDLSIHSDELIGRRIGNDFHVKDGFRMYHGQKFPGFPYHPHRGFETITINKEGAVDHTDSKGAIGRFMDGDVQWMTAGNGIQHSEMFPLLNQDKPNPLEIFQVWLNLPAASKGVDPHFKMLWKEDIPVVVEGKATIDVIAGQWGSHSAPKPTPNSWAADPQNGVGVFTIELDTNGSVTLPAIDPAIQRSVYFYTGEQVTIGDIEIDTDSKIDLKPDKETVIKNQGAKAYFLVLEGKPINEPVAMRGPFVMNTREEISQTIREYQETQFGGWPWPAQEWVHDASKGRFAKHSDGREEERT